MLSFLASLGYNRVFSVFDSLDVNILDGDFLVKLGCAPALHTLDLSYSEFVSLPAGLIRFINLKELWLEGCQMLQEVLELPPNLQTLFVRDCLSLKTVSKLSNILKHQEWQMFERLDLSNCQKLCNNLVQEAEQKGLYVNDDHQAEADLFSLFLSSLYTEFKVIFPASHKIPKWFSCRMDCIGNGVFEIDIQVLANFKWRKTGLALCVTGHGKDLPYWCYKIRINEVLVRSKSDDEYSRFDETDSPCVWLENIPFNSLDMRRFGDRHPRPPFICQVSIYQIPYPNAVPLKSCGVHTVHLVMPPNQECMKLSQARRIESENYLAELESSEDYIVELE